MSSDGTSLFITAPDGLRLHILSYGPRGHPTHPVVCLPGLARTAADFHALAMVLANDPANPRHVLAVDYRGRGLSDYDRNPGNYSLPVELADLIAALTALEVPPAVFVGTSRGGILTMLLASARPAAIAAVALNDIGPVIEPRGLVRIKSYLGRLPQPKSFEEGAKILQRLFEAQFPRLTSDEWIAFSRRTFRQQDGRFVPRYDPKLSRVLHGASLEHRLSPLWKQFDALSGVPLMVIRGANSDLLSAGTVATMHAHRPDMEYFEIADQGHAPMLVEDGVIARIAAFVARA